jgi:hypothetical protein
MKTIARLRFFFILKFIQNRAIKTLPFMVQVDKTTNILPLFFAIKTHDSYISFDRKCILSEHKTSVSSRAVAPAFEQVAKHLFFKKNRKILMKRTR